MMKDAIRALETGAMAEVALLAFVVAFVTILVYVFTLKRSAIDEMQNLPFHDGLPDAGAPSTETTKTSTDA
jgi:cbb3-type cytochrome oxidase subunit 3